MYDLMKIGCTFLFIVLLIRKKLNVGFALILASIMIFILYGLNVKEIGKTFYNTIFSSVTIELLTALTFIRMLEMILRENNILKQMMNSVKSLLRNKRFVMVSMPLLIGMLPSVGGAYFSCPMVEEASEGLNLKSEEKAFINYWYRHPWEFILPVYPGIILASVLSGVSINQLILLNLGYAIIMMLAGVLFSMTTVKGSFEKENGYSKKSLFSFFPIIFLLALVIITGMPLSYALIIVVLSLLLFYRYDREAVVKVLKYGISKEVIILIIGVMLFKESLDSSHGVINLSRFFVDNNIPALPLLFLLPFLTGLLTGISVGFVGITFPILSGLYDISAYAYSFAFAAGFIGVLLSPVHVCLILTKEYFKAQLWRIYAKTIPAGLMLIIAAFLLNIALTGCSSKTADSNDLSQNQLSKSKDKSEDNDKPEKGGFIVTGSIGSPSNLIPMLAGDNASHEIAGLIFNGLVKYDTDLTIIGDLAESWDISKDGLVLTFHLRKGVKWSDGVEFTAYDVLFGYNTIRDEKTPSAYKEDYLQVKNAQVIDKYTFQARYEKPLASALSSWSSLIVLPEHLLKGQDITKSKLTRNPVGTGPYILEEWTEGQQLVLRANDNYFEGRPYIDKFIYRIIPDISTMFLELKAGNIDFMGLNPIQYTKQTDTPYFNSTYNKYKYPSFKYTYLGFNLKHPFFQNKRVRQAIAYAIDKQEIVNVVLFGTGFPATGPYVPNTWPYNSNVRRYDYNPEKAKTILASLGWKDRNNDGIIDKDNTPFEFTIITNMGNNDRIKTATIIQWRLQQIGIKVNIRAIEWSTLLNEFIDKKRFEAVVMGWAIGLDADQYSIWHSSKTGQREFNFISFANNEADQLLEEGRRTLDINKRKQIYYKFQQILADEVPYIFLFVGEETPIVNKRFKGIKPTALGITYNIDKWFVPKEFQKTSYSR
ncbi:peptide ABC transporter substrate binding protein [Candidatus Magnetoovum chiemensis]|nr:peptide ABC transporter substrate binding protein [Candidatus Magnetoovum chiemensis]